MSGFVIKNKEFGAEEPLVCLPVTKNKKEEIVQEVIRLRDMGADIIEWRVDAFECATDLNAIRELLVELEPIVENVPLLYTFRSKAQGGLMELSASQIYDIHQIGAESSAVDLVDVELFPAEHPAREIADLQSKGVKVIASHHDFMETPDEDVLFSILTRMMDCGADIVKLAVMPQCASDVIALMQTTVAFHDSYPEVPVVTMSMGELGMLSRISGKMTGSSMTFGNPGQASAPGQIPYEKLREILALLSGN